MPPTYAARGRARQGAPSSVPWPEMYKDEEKSAQFTMRDPVPALAQGRRDRKPAATRNLKAVVSDGAHFVDDYKSAARRRVTPHIVEPAPCVKHRPEVTRSATIGGVGAEWIQGGPRCDRPAPPVRPTLV